MIKFLVGLTLLASSLAVADTAKDRGIVNQAREKYAQGKLTEAEQLYSKIEPNSDYWLLAIEERAHTHGKAGNYNKALADLTTLISPVFEKSLGPEPYFTAALTYLRLCQYDNIFSILNKYKENMKARTLALVSIADREADQKVLDILKKVNEKGSAGYADKSIEYPGLFHLDGKLQNYLAAKNNTKALERVATLAKEDLKEISSTTKKLHLIEAEVMQRLHKLEEAKDENRTHIGKIKANSKQLEFPHTDELWIDEVNSYQVEADQCPKGKI